MEPIILKWAGDDKFDIVGGRAIEDISPKQMLVYALGACAGKTAVALFAKMRLTVDNLVIEAVGEFDDEVYTHMSWYSRFKLVMRADNVAENEVAKVVHALQRTEEKYCIVSLMLSKIAPVESQIFVNGKLME
jgi:uncharacterized OsmC-like protein